MSPVAFDFGQTKTAVVWVWFGCIPLGTAAERGGARAGVGDPLDDGAV